MPKVSATIFHFVNDEIQRPPFTATFDYTEELEEGRAEQLKVSIGVGDNTASSVVTLPVVILNALMRSLMQAHEGATKSSIILPDTPSFLKGN